MFKSPTWQSIALWFRMHAFGHRFKTHTSKLDAKLLGGISDTYTTNDLKFYTSKVGESISVTMWHVNAERFISFIQILHDHILKEDNIPQELLIKERERVTLSLDNWLVDDENYDIDIQAFWETLLASTYDIYEKMEELELSDPAKYAYYTRRMMVLFQDISTIMGGLRRVVLLDYGK